MADLISRTLRDGGVEGEHAPALTIKDSIVAPFGPDVFDHMLTQLASNVAAGKSQSKGIVLVALSKSPRYYTELLKRFEKWVCVFDCYSDPLGWNKLISKGSEDQDEGLNGVRVIRDVRDLGKMLNLILECGGGVSGGGDGKNGRFSVAVDLLSEVLRYGNVSTVAGFLSKLRSDKQVASMLWLLRSDLCDVRSVSVFEYVSTMVGSLELKSDGKESKDTRRADMAEMGVRSGRFCVRIKRRNGRVKIVTERFQVEKAGVVKFMAGTEDGGVGGGQDVLGKLQFNLQLSEKEKKDRAQVVLPFEHQEHGKANQIYDGRRSQKDAKEGEGIAAVEKMEANEEGSGKGEIIYFRDSDDEMPDSDEDPDDDLDI